MNKKDNNSQEGTKKSSSSFKNSILGSSLVKRLSIFGGTSDANSQTKKPSLIRKSTQRNEFLIQDYTEPTLLFDNKRPYIRTMTISFLNAQYFENWNVKFDKLANEINQLKPDIIGIYDIKLGETFSSLPPLEYFLSKINLPYQAVFQPEKQSTNFVIGTDVDGCLVLTRYKIYDISNTKLSRGKTDNSNCMLLLLRMMTPFGIIDFAVGNVSYEFEVLRENLKETKKFLDLERRKGTKGQILVGNLNLFMQDVASTFVMTTENQLEDGFYDIVQERSVKIGKRKNISPWDLHRSVYYRGRFISAYRDDLEYETMLEKADDGTLKDEEKAYCIAEFTIDESIATKELAYYLFEEGLKDANAIRGVGSTILNQAQKSNANNLEVLQQRIRAKPVESSALQAHLQKIAEENYDVLEGWNESLIVIREFENNEKYADVTQGATAYCLSTNKVELDGKSACCEIGKLSFYKEKFVINKKKTVF